MINKFEKMLTGGHPNSLGNTVEVVNQILKDKNLLDDLYQCYFSKDAVVRLRVSSAMKRVCIEHPEWLVPYIDRLLNEIAKINQASTQWTLAILFLKLEKHMSDEQMQKAKKHLKKILETNDDWIVQNTVIDTLSKWAKTDEKLKKWITPRLEEFARTGRKSVAGRSKKMLVFLS
jgi:hypothetical protein